MTDKRHCTVCGSEFVPKMRTQVRCSKTCTEAHRALQSEKLGVMRAGATYQESVYRDFDDDFLDNRW